MYEITIDNFKGPLDLLLHLIKEAKMDIMDIKLDIIIDEYLKYIKEMQRMNLDVASSYLVMASELVEIKSRKLLPRDEEEETDEEINPEEELINRLIEYQKYKDQIDNFKRLEEERLGFYTKTPENLDQYKGNIKVDYDLELDDLVKAMEKFLEREILDTPLSTKITKKEISVEDRIKDIKEKFKREKRIDFYSLFDNKNKENVIVTFLAVLELAKLGEIRIMQDNNFSSIICEAQV